MLKRFVQYYKPHKKLFILDMIAAFIVSGCDLFYPIITRNMLNDYIPNGKIRVLCVWAALLTLIYIFRMALYYFINYVGHCVGIRMQADMRRDLFSHLQKLPFGYYDSNETGTILSRIVNDLMEVSELAHHGPEDVAVSVVLLIGSFIYLSTINLYLSLILFLFVPLMLVFSAKMRRSMSKAFMESRKKIGAINASVEDSISGIRVSRAFNNMEYEKARFEKGNQAFLQARAKAYKTMAVFFSGTGFMISMLNTAVLLFGGIFTYKGMINYADLAAFMLSVNMFVTPIRTLVNFTEQYQNGMTGFKRFIEIMDVPAEQESPTARDIGVVKGDISFKNVTFSYSEDDNGIDALRDVTLDIPAGKTVALVGPSGGGKTTFCNLIPRFYRVTQGEIYIDGVPISEITLESLRRNIGIVAQDVFLFGGTIRENIAYGNPEAPEAEIIDAARKSGLLEFIESLPQGFDTQVGERGVKLSGGQKQRISIARVFLKNPRILILDEATSALDTATEKQIKDALDKLAEGRTSLVVAHRLSTVRNADEIIVVSDGRTVERGTHEELKALGGIYASISSFS